MNVVAKKQKNQEELIKVTVSPADYEEAVTKTLKDYRKKANIPGFRPGMVPMGVVNKMYRKNVLAEETYRAAYKGMGDYIEKHKMEILGDPMPAESQPELDFAEGTEFEFHFRLGLAPEVNIDLAAVTVPRYDVTVDKKTKDNYRQNLLQRHGKLVDAEAVTSDEAITGTLTQGDKSIEEAYIGLVGMKEADRKPFIGKKVGDTMEIDVNEVYASPAHRASALGVKEEELAGIDPKYTLTITKIRKFELPQITEEFLKEAFKNEEMKTEADFDKYVAAQIKKELEREVEFKFIVDTRKAMIDAAKLTLPEAFLKDWLFAVNQGKFSKEEIEKEFPQFLEMMQWDVIRKKYAAEGEIKVTEEDMLNEARNIARIQFAQYGLPDVEGEMLDHYAKQLLNSKEEGRKLYDSMFERKVIDYIATKVQVKKEKISLEKFSEQLR